MNSKKAANLIKSRNTIEAKLVSKRNLILNVNRTRNIDITIMTLKMTLLKEMQRKHGREQKIISMN